ncbi:hypothetical protein DFH08DRAFT_928149 [Mycena albidolilacea]|uniref:Kinetochore protein Sos7 coiled-coil domain-containing protein n=1 Tax=Mycena albidolilacea TaxID=1033008 RepID=A0AAD7F6H4_9AGAR|nr:hypothetical protein DFH08DRAFT_928149 [Mycena albidolilacea]
MEQDPVLQGAKAFQTAFDKANLHLVHNVSRLNAPPDDGSDTDENKDPAVVAQDLVAQTSFLRKLKFRYLEQNAKSKYITAIVSDIDDAAIVTAEDNKALSLVCEEKKEKLRVAKAGLAEVRTNIRTLAPKVEADYVNLKDSAAKAALLREKIIDARLALTRLRHAHPSPRLTIPAAEQRLTDQVTEMQVLMDDIEQAAKKVQSVKGSVKSGTQEVESLRAERAEVEKAVKAARVNEDDGRLVPLYDQNMASLAFHKSALSIHDSQLVSENELRLTYIVRRRQISITLIFQPNTKQLATASVSGLDELGIDVSELLDSHIHTDDAHGLIAAVLAIARAAS